MKIINRIRRGGKTHELVALFRADPRGHLIVHNAAVREDVIRAYKLSPAQQHRVFVACNNSLAGTTGDIYVDNAELVLGALLGRTPAVITVTAEKL